MNHETVAKRFNEGYTNGAGYNMYIEGDCLFSYGSHFVLAKRKDDLFLLNGDRYSNSTSKHQSITRQELGYNSPTTSFSALSNAGIGLDSLKIIDFTGDETAETIVNLKEFKAKIPVGATVTYSRDKFTGEINRIGYHLAGSILILHDEKYYICGMDDNSYFVSELPHVVKTVKNAYASLKPEIVQEYEVEHPEDIIHRQGEWFFIPYSHYKVKKKDFVSNISLPTTDSQSNFHKVTRYILKGKTILCHGTVRHSQHKMVKLGNVIHRAVCNTAVNNWSVSGVD